MTLTISRCQLTVCEEVSMYITVLQAVKLVSLTTSRCYRHDLDGLAMSQEAPHEHTMADYTEECACVSSSNNAHTMADYTEECACVSSSNNAHTTVDYTEECACASPSNNETNSLGLTRSNCLRLISLYSQTSQIR